MCRRSDKQLDWGEPSVSSRAGSVVGVCLPRCMGQTGVVGEGKRATREGGWQVKKAVEGWDKFYKAKAARV